MGAPLSRPDTQLVKESEAAYSKITTGMGGSSRANRGRVHDAGRWVTEDGHELLADFPRQLFVK
ncbi:MAG TPA: hypothetical protein VNG93_14800 [Candidatus Dormibacteraeota bacterium]|nr:hypothetical protein [Candidatus Dormibacteraeota bacterium]